MTGQKQQTLSVSGTFLCPQDRGGGDLHATTFWFTVALHGLTGVKSDIPWKKPGTPGSVTVMEGAGPEPGPPGPAAPPSREPRSWARFPSGLPSAGWPMEVVLVVWVDVCPEVLAERGGGDVVEESDEDEVETDCELAEEELDMGSPGAENRNLSGQRVVRCSGHSQ